MHKLCSLKELTPGCVVELPKRYASRDAETAVVLGLAYAEDKTRIKTDLIKQDVATGEFISVAMPAESEDAQLVVVDDDAVLSKAAVRGFVASKIALPALGLSLGCDPEIFVQHADETVFPAWEFMPSEEAARVSIKEWMTKSVLYQKKDYASTGNDDFMLPNAGQNWADPNFVRCPHAVPAYWDGAQAEFAPWAKTCLETLHYGTREGLKSVLGFARAKDPTAKLTLHNVIELPQATLQNTPQEFIQFRCSRSYNVYGDPGDGGGLDARQYKYRCAGGHVHLGFTRLFTAPGIEQIVRGLDGVLGVIGVSLAAGIDNPERRHTYGRAGEFRLPSHGVEYRVLSNFWLSHPAIAMLVFEIARIVVRFAESGLYNLCWVAREEEIRDVINNCDVDGAREILRRNTPVLAGLLNALWVNSPCHSTRMRAMALKTIVNGIGATVANPYDIEGNWKLNNDEAWKYHCRGEGDNWKSFVEEMK